jgi:transcriptional regulator with XRE-family HTH domain
MDSEFFWQMVRKEVAAQNTSFEWLYQKTKIAKGTLSSWKSRGAFPHADEAFRIANALGVSLNYLLTGTDNVPERPHKQIDKIIENLGLMDENDLTSMSLLSENMVKRYKKPS